MSQIKVLDELTIDKIAAGEVIERPASVVKELVENAIDSKANAITVEIKEGGISFIRITDNGCGIDKNEVATAFLRHATSKIRSVTDLITIHSLGFRGEALSSIAAISKVEVITKTSSALTGVRYQIAGGKEISTEEIGCPEGTTFLIRDLFYNVPARQKFLKTPQTEGAHIYELIQQLALSHPEISFQFIMNGQNRFHTSGNGNLKDIIYSIYGKDIAKNLLPISFSDTELKLKLDGYIGKPIISRGNRGFENYYINQRYTKSNIITKAIEEAYKTFTMIHKFPFVCLCFEMDPGQLDINVHPSKMEVRFHKERKLFDCLKEEIRTVLLHQDLIPDVNIDKPKKTAPIKTFLKGAQPFEKQRRVQENEKITANLVQESHSYVYSDNSTKKETQVKQKDETSNPAFSKMIAAETKVSPVLKNINSNNFLQSEVTQKVNSSFEPEVTKENSSPIQTTVTKQENSPIEKQALQLSFFDEKKQASYTIIGQLFKTYWLIEYNNKLLIMDQHAAHEKVNYERFMKHFSEKKNLYIQQVSPPIIVTLSPKEKISYEEYKDYFAELGFEIEAYGNEEYCIRGVPTDLYGIADKNAFIELLDEICENIHGTDTSMIANKIATMACKASVKGNQKLSMTEAQALIDELMTLDSPFTCPHGRPTIISMTKTEIEKKFKRIQS